MLSESLDFAASARNILQAVCESLNWAVGAVWRVDRQAEAIRCVEVYHATSMETPEFDRLTRNIAFKKGVGLPGRIWELGQPAWINNVSADDNFPRAPVAAREGLRCAFGFPILLGSAVWGVIEFFSPEIREPDEELLQLVAGLGGQPDSARCQRRQPRQASPLCWWSRRRYRPVATVASSCHSHPRA